MKDNVKIILAEIERLKKLPKKPRLGGSSEIPIPDIDRQEWILATKRK